MCSTRIAIVLAGLLAVNSARAADLRMRFVLDREAPVPKPLVINKDAECCGQHGLVDESLLVDPKTNGIANVVVYLVTGRRGVKLDSLDLPAPEKRAVSLIAEHCRFRPRVVLARAGDTLVCTDRDSVGHNFNISFLKNMTPSFTLPTKERKEKLIQLRLDEPAPVPVECNIHPWMKAKLLVLDHRFAAVSDRDGFVEIKGLPDNRNLMFRVYHERLSFRASPVAVVDCRGPSHSASWQYQEWKLNRFERTLSAGNSPLETILVSRKHLPGIDD